MKSWEINKKNYIDFVYSGEEVSKSVKYNLYEKNIKMYEDIKEKDLMEFNIEELIDLMDSIPTTAISVKDNVYSFISQYLDYQISRGNISINNMVAIDRKKATSVHKRSTRSKYISMSNFEKIVNDIRRNSDWQYIIALCMARFGIKGKDSEDIINLKISDIDIERKMVYIKDKSKNIIKCIPVNETFIDWCKKAENEKGYFGENIMKFNKESRNRLITESIIHARTKRACELAGYKRMSLNNLVLSRKLDMILEIRKDRKLTNGDFQQINLIFNPEASAGSYTSFVRFYESISGGDTVYKIITPKEELDDPNAREFVKKLKEELDIME